MITDILTSSTANTCVVNTDKIATENDEEQAYLESALGHRDPATPQEKAWLKYQARINRPKTASIYGSKRAAEQDVDDDDDMSDNSDLDIDLDD